MRKIQNFKFFENRTPFVRFLPFLHFLVENVFFTFFVSFLLPKYKIWADAFFCDLNIPPPPDTYPKTKISQKQKIASQKIALNLYQKISKTKDNFFEQKIPPWHTYPDLSTFTANLSKKIHAKNLKIFFKKIFLKKNLFLVYEKRDFFLGGGKFPGKMFRSQKKAARSF